LVLFFFLWYKWGSFKLIAWHWLVAIGVIGLLTSVWFAAEIIQGGGWALFQQFFDYQVRLFTSSEAGHGQPFYYHFVVLFIGCFPISLIAFPYILKLNFPDAEAKVKDLYTVQFILFWVVLILFSLTTTKILHYSSLCYFPLSFIAAYVVNRKIEQKERISTFSFLLLGLVGSVLAIAFTALPLLIRYKDAVIPLVKDRFAVQNMLMPVTWGGWEFLIGALYFSLLLLVLMRLRKQTQYVVYLFLLNAIMLNALMMGIVPKLEQHLQGSLISFFRAHQGSDAYVTTFGFKSYAQYFYTNKQAPMNRASLEDQWLITGPIDKPVYIVSKIFQREEVLRHPDIKLLYEQGGFVFYVRMPKAYKH
jgi:4-amino-4-deoxy-L-arabinose transferase-like glycosyltransferase